MPYYKGRMWESQRSERIWSTVSNVGKSHSKSRVESKSSSFSNIELAVTSLILMLSRDPITGQQPVGLSTRQGASIPWC